MFVNKLIINLKETREYSVNAVAKVLAVFHRTSARPSYK